MKYLVGALLSLLVLAVIGLALILLGAYNVAATEPHSAFGQWVLETTLHKSIETRAKRQASPPSSSPERRAGDGFEHFHASCEQCHGAPGVEPAEWARDMRPDPPDLAEEAAEWSDEEIFWIVQHGLKMTGMPAFGPTHSDEELWSIVRFVKALPELSPEEYGRRVAESAANQETHSHH